MEQHRRVGDCPAKGKQQNYNKRPISGFRLPLSDEKRFQLLVLLRTRSFGAWKTPLITTCIMTAAPYGEGRYLLRPRNAFGGRGAGLVFLLVAGDRARPAGVVLPLVLPRSRS